MRAGALASTWATAAARVITCACCLTSSPAPSPTAPRHRLCPTIRLTDKGLPMTDTEETAVVSPLDEKGQAYFAEHYTDPIIHLATAVYVGSLLKLKDYPF